MSIVIIAYNEQKYLSAAIESVLNQTYKNIEVIVVDDGSTDNTLAIAREFEPKLTVISQKNSGGCSSPRNTGLRHANGRYIAFLDADDILVPQKIAMQVDQFLTDDSVCMVIGNYQNFSGANKHTDHFATCPELITNFSDSESGRVRFEIGDAASLLISENFSIAGSPLFLKSVLIELGGFNETLLACEDFHLIYRIAQRYPVMAENRIVLYRRLHGNNMSFNQLKMLRFYCLSRLLLAGQEANVTRKNFLRLRVWSYFKNYIKIIIRRGAVLQLRYAVPIAFKYWIGKFPIY